MIGWVLYAVAAAFFTAAAAVGGGIVVALSVAGTCAVIGAFIYAVIQL